MSSRILLVNPPFYRLLGSHYNANSLGIAYIASYLNKNGHDAWREQYLRASFTARQPPPCRGNHTAVFSKLLGFFKHPLATGCAE